MTSTTSTFLIYGDILDYQTAAVVRPASRKDWIYAREVGAARLVELFDMIRGAELGEQRKLGLSYTSSDPYGAVRAGVAHLCLATISDTIAEIVAAEGLDVDGSGVIKDGSVKRRLRQALLDALNADIAADEAA